MILELLGMRLATYIDLGKALDVSTNQVYMWYYRRGRNGFPEPVFHRTAGNGAKNAPWFDMDEVLAWHAHYRPQRGGFHSHAARETS